MIVNGIEIIFFNGCISSLKNEGYLKFQPKSIGPTLNEKD